MTNQTVEQMIDLLETCDLNFPLSDESGYFYTLCDPTAYNNFGGYPYLMLERHDPRFRDSCLGLTTLGLLAVLIDIMMNEKFSGKDTKVMRIVRAKYNELPEEFTIFVRKRKPILNVEWLDK